MSLDNPYISSDWWTTCYSTYSCLYWDALPTMNITINGGNDTLMLTTYSFLNPLTDFDTPYSVDNSNTETSADLDDPFQCQLMFSFAVDNYNVSNMTMGMPFFRQYGVQLNYSSQELSFVNQTNISNQYLQDPTQEINNHGVFTGIVAFIIVCASLAVFGAVSYGIYWIHQKIHARNENWTTEDEALETA